MAPTRCDLACDLQDKFRRACDQLLTFIAFPGAVDVTNNGCERDLRPAVVQRKVTNGYRSMWAAEGEADVRTVVDTARLGQGPPAQHHPQDHRRLNHDIGRRTGHSEERRVRQVIET